MDNGIIQLTYIQFGTIYLLLLVLLGVMKFAKIDQSKLLLTASFRMSIQLFAAGMLLTYIFGNPRPIFVVAYLFSMVSFSTVRILRRNSHLNSKFKTIIFGSILVSGVSVIIFFVGLVVRTSLLDPQYVIPIGGMIMGNAMNGLSLGIKTLTDNINLEKNKIETLVNAGIEPKEVLLPFVNNALEMAFIPTLNSMMNMGIISLPGMMTGQMLSGTVPMTAILYQIAIMIAITTGVVLTSFSTLYLGYRTLINHRKQIVWEYK